jgi:hypothetical protein
MKISIKLIISSFILFLLSCLQVFGQTAPRLNGNYYNLEKYWFYRCRLINDFMKIGPNCGEGMPFGERKNGILRRLGNKLFQYN